MNANVKKQNRKSNNKKKQPRRRKVAGKKAVKKGTMINRGLSSCALRYLASIKDPFDHMDIPCVPDMIALDSRRVKVFAKGALTTGTSVGFVCFNPFRGARTSVTETLTSVRFSDAGFTGTAITTDAAAIGVTGVNTNAEYTDTQTGGVSYRLISAGLRVRYLGTELNRGGLIQIVEEPAHYTLHNHDTTNLNAYDNSRRYPVTDNQWACVTYSPRYPYELAFIDVSKEPDNKAQGMIDISIASQTNTGCAWCLGFLVTPAAGTSAIPFAFECFANYEYIGDQVRGKVPSEADPVGLAAVLNATRLQEPFLTSMIPRVAAQSLREANSALKMQSRPGLN